MARTYKPGHIFDEDKSVRWNREKLDEENAKYKQEQAEYHAAVQEGEDRFQNDILAYIESEYKLNNAQAKIIFSMAYQYGHSSGFYDVLTQAQTFSEFANNIILARWNHWQSQLERILKKISGYEFTQIIPQLQEYKNMLRPHMRKKLKKLHGVPNHFHGHC